MKNSDQNKKAKNALFYIAMDQWSTFRKNRSRLGESHAQTKIALSNYKTMMEAFEASK